MPKNTCHYREMLAHLKSLGFTIVSCKGSHNKLEDNKGRTLVVNINSKKRVLSPGVYHTINKKLAEFGYKNHTNSN